MGVQCSRHTVYQAEGAGYPRQRRVALIGIGCQFAGGINNPETFWEAVRSGRDCTCEAPAARFDVAHWTRGGPVTPGRMYTSRGGFLTQDPFEFDPGFFHMLQGEADHLDPMVRLLLCQVWNALEDAGIPPSSLRGSNTGVFAGCTAAEFTQFTSLSLENMTKYSNSGTNSCMVANRVSYEFDFRGPSFTVDTACSSSLYAMILACESLRAGECDLAVVGGVNLILLPNTTIGFCQAEMMARDGRCKSFDASADGYARGEGVGVVILRRAEDAHQAGERVYAELLGGRVCNDGKTAGIANPSQAAQEGMLEASMRVSMVAPADVSYVEAHGTGTQAGDRAELSAIGNVIGRERSSPLAVGSVKSNIAHTEGAAGVAGVIKTALMLYHDELLPTCGYTTPRPDLDLAVLGLTVPTQPQPWTGPGRVAMVNSFGFGGANASLVLSKTGTTRRNIGNGTTFLSVGSTFPLVCSGHSVAALYARLEQIKHILGQDPTRLYDICASTALHHDHLQYRHAVPVETAGQALEQIQALLRERRDVPAAEDGLFVVFVFNGMGSQYAHMGRELLQRSPAFRAAIQAFDKEMKDFGQHWSVEKIISKGKRDINKTKYAQPCVCALQLGLLAELRAGGVTPDLVLGHSVGEVAAAHAAGILSLRDTVRLIVTRGTLQHKLAGRGSMVAVLGGNLEEDMSALCDPREVSVACVNSDSQAVYSGNTKAIDALAGELEARGRKVVRLNVNNAFHSHQVEGIKEGFLLATRAVLSQDPMPVVPMVSTVTGQRESAGVLVTPEYWYRNMRDTVQLGDALRAVCAATDRPIAFVEIGASGILQSPMKETVLTKDSKVSVLKTLQKKGLDNVNLMSTTLKLYQLGCKVDVSSWFQAPYSRVSLPPYPFQLSVCKTVSAVTQHTLLRPAEGHPLLRKQCLMSGQRGLWRSEVSAHDIPWVRHHLLSDTAVFPAAGFLDMVLAALLTSPNNNNILLSLSHIRFQKFWALSEEKSMLYLETTQVAAHKTEIKVYTASGDSETQHCVCEWLKGRENEQIMSPLTDGLEQCTVEATQQQMYETFQTAGFTLGPSFQSLLMCSCSADFTQAVFTVTEPPHLAGEIQRHVIHPGVLDAVFQSVAYLSAQHERASNRNTTPHQQVPYFVSRLHVNQALLSVCKRPADLVIFLRRAPGDDVTHDAALCEQVSGEVVLQLEGVAFRAVQQTVSAPRQPVTWRLSWTPVTELPTGHTMPDHTIILADELFPGAQNGFTGVLRLGKFRVTKEQLQRINTIVVVLSSCENSVDNFDMALLDRATQLERFLLEVNDLAAPPVLWLVTVRAQAVWPGEPACPATQALASLALTQYTELRDLDIKSLDVERAEQALSVVTSEEVGALLEDEMAVRSEGEKLILYGRRLNIAPHTLNHQQQSVQNWKLEGRKLVEIEQIETQLKPVAFRPAGSNGYSVVCVDKESRTCICPYTSTISSGIPSCDAIRLSSSASGLIMVTLLHNTLNFLDYALNEPVQHETVRFIFLDNSNYLETTLKALALQSRGWTLTKSTDDAETLLYDLTQNAESFIDTLRHKTVICVTDDVQKICKLAHVDTVYVRKNNWAVARDVVAFLDNIIQTNAINLDSYKIDIESVKWSSTLEYGDKIIELPAEMTVDTEMYRTEFRAQPGLCYVVTGGTRGLGLQCARWLFERGASDVVVLGRRIPAEVQAAVDTYRRQNLNLMPMRADVSKEEDIRSVFNELLKRNYIIAGIFHAAVSYVDGYMPMTKDQWQNSLYTKSRSALILHELSVTLQLPLTHFVLFSSATILAGSEGQANYVVANVYLQGLAAMRRALGLPACTVSFGTISDVGGALERGVVEHWRARGIGDLPSYAALAIMGDVITGPDKDATADAGIVGPDTDLQLYANFVFRLKDMRNGCSASRFKDIYNDVTRENEFEAATKQMSAEEVRRQIRDTMTDIISERGHIPRDTVTAAARLSHLGMDSILATELAIVLTEAFGASVTAIDLLNERHSTADLVEKIHRKLQTKRAGTKPEHVPTMSVLKSIEEIYTGTETSVFLFPPMPGGQTVMKELIQCLVGKSVFSVFIVKVPGWEDRPGEPPLSEITACVGEVMADLQTLVSSGRVHTDTVFYGHSSGALLAYETIHAMRQAGLSLPTSLIVGAWKAPSYHYHWPDMPSIFAKSAPVSDVVNDLEKLGIFPQRVLQNAAYMTHYAETIRANLRMVIGYRRPARPALPVRLTVLAGREDRFCTRDMQDEWREEVTHATSFYTMPGGHLFLTESKAVVKIVNQMLI